MLSVEMLRGLPKVALHDHLDGGLRPETVIAHCREAGHALPSQDPGTLEEWFFDAANSGSLVRYLETFEHTVAAMQTAEHLTAVAREFVIDQAADAVVYAEARYAPQQHLSRGLSVRQVVEAVHDGLEMGMAEVAASGRQILARQIVTSMRHAEPSTDIARLALDYRDHTVCGFDIAGAELGFRPSRFIEAFSLLRRENMFFTIHAGEADGVESIWEAVQVCGASRIGHGVRIVEDIAEDGSLGRVAAYVRDARIPLEVAPSSNLQTGIAGAIAEHPVGRLFDLGFAITINCDNRLVSRTTLSREFALLSEAFGWGIPEVERCTVTAMRAAFLPYPQRERFVREVIEPAYVGMR